MEVVAEKERVQQQRDGRAYAVDDKSAGVALYVKAFQNGVELEHAFLTEDYGADNEMKEIRPGTTLEITEAFLVTDTTAVEFEATELISLSDDMVVATYEFNAE